MKWYAYVIIALVVAVAVLAYMLQRNAQLLKSCNEIAHLQYVTYHDEVIEYNEKIGRLGSAVARQKHELDSVTQSHARTQTPLKSNIKTWKERIDPVERIAVLINGKNTGDTTVYFTSKEEALRYLYDQMVARDTTIYWQDSLIRDMETERATVKVKTDELVNSIKAKARLSEDEVSKWIGRYQESEARRAQDEKAWKRQRRLERVLGIGGVVLIVIIVL